MDMCINELFRVHMNSHLYIKTAFHVHNGTDTTLEA